MESLLVKMKTCSNCDTPKILADFHRQKDAADGRTPVCKACRKIIGEKYREQNRDKLKSKDRAYYQANKPLLIEKSKKYQQKNRKRIQSHRSDYYILVRRPYYLKKAALGAAFIAKLKDKPCTDCGSRFPPECMDFDHIDGKKKWIDVSKLKVYSQEIILAEISKCELVCACCHRIRTAKRVRSNRSQVPSSS